MKQVNFTARYITENEVYEYGPACGELAWPEIMIETSMTFIQVMRGIWGK